MTLQILHFNDVYRVAPQKISPKSNDTIDVTQFGALLDGLRAEWPECQDGKRDGLVLFSGDLFSPSVESSVTRGSHMVPVINELAPDVALTGNHDFDFGYPHLTKLVQNTTFPWLLSNIIDNTTGKIPETLHEFQVLERSGVRIGIIGLVEKEWIGTVSSWPANFEHREMATIGKELSKRLRDPAGEHKCDILIALTHSRVPNDIALAKDLLALSPASQEKTSITNEQGADLILGGHDHLFYVSSGFTAFEGYDLKEKVLGGEEDHGDVLVLKSGTDFRDLSELTLELTDSPEGSVRRKVISKITGKRHTTQPGSKSSETLTKLLEKLLSNVSSTLKAPVCNTTVCIDCRSELIRTEETASTNWFADIVRHAYDDALCMKGCGGSDIVFLCAGTFRGDSMYGPGVVTLGDVLEILPFEDPIVVQEVDGAAIWSALEASLSTWPAQEGRFPTISGFRFSWDSRKPAGDRVLGVWLQSEDESSEYGSDAGSGTSTPRLVDGPEISREPGGRLYKMVTRQYMSEGHDGYTAFAGKKYLIDDENGQMMSTIVRRYLLGSQFVNKMARLPGGPTESLLSAHTRSVIEKEKAHQTRHAVQHPQGGQKLWKFAAGLALRWSRSRDHYRDQFRTAGREHMSEVDAFDGAAMRALGPESSMPVSEQPQAEANLEKDDDLLTVSPLVDGRMKDAGRS